MTEDHQPGADVAEDQPVESSNGIDGTGAAGYGFPGGLWRALERHPPPGIGRARAWRSPLRGPWLTSVFGAVLLLMLPLVIVTGLLDYIAYGPQFGQALPVDVGWLHLPTFDWPTRPSWLFRLTEGLHVGVGLIMIPVVLAKLWSVIPRLFVWPPAKSVAQALERISLLMLVGGVLFEIATGLLNIQYDYVFGFDFYTAHYYGAWVFIAGFVMHVAIKLPTLVASLRSRSFRAVLKTTRADTVPEPPDPDRLVAANPHEATISRRGALALVAGGSALVGALTLGQTIGGFTRQFALLIPRGRDKGDGPNDFEINRTSTTAGITSAETGPAWRLSLSGTTSQTLDRAALLALPQHTAVLPIACVEGWSTTQTWSGVPLGYLAGLAGVPDPHSAHVQSLETRGSFNQATLQANQILDPDALLALRVNGVDLSLDHGFPARIIVPALPGVHNTKWVRSIDFRGQ